MIRKKPHICRSSYWTGYWICGMHSPYVMHGYDYLGKSPREAYEGWKKQFQ